MKSVIEIHTEGRAQEPQRTRLSGCCTALLSSKLRTTSSAMVKPGDGHGHALVSRMATERARRAERLRAHVAALARRPACRPGNSAGSFGIRCVSEGG